MTTIAFVIHFFLANTHDPPVLSFHRSFTFHSSKRSGDSNIGQSSATNSIFEDRKTSLFGFAILLSVDNAFVIVSAPGRKPSSKAYGGDVFKCSVNDLEHSCQTILNDAKRGYIGIGTEHIPFQFGVSMLRNDMNHIMICQAHRGGHDGLIRNCQCYCDESYLFSSEDTCLITKFYKDVSIPFLNLFQVKLTNMKKRAILGSRHFPGQIVKPSNEERGERTKDVYSGIAVLNTESKASNREPFIIRDPENPAMIPTIGFATGRLFPPKTEALVMATNDDNAQRGILSFYDLPSGNESIALQLTIINRKWQSFTNFGNKIVIGDFTGDSYNDVLVTSPTSKWLDLPEVGHAHLFMNTKSDTFFTDTSTIIRGLPIAHSFFGWNAKTVGDLDGDGVKDFLIAALKVSESDLRGGIYVYLGSDDILIRGLTYYEIIQPSTNLENELTGFGFFISSKMVLDREGNSYVMVSRVFSGEVDVYKISPRFPIKVSVVIEPNRFTVDENFISMLSEERLTNPQIKIISENINEPLYATIKLSFKHSSNYHSFHQDYPLETYVTEKRIRSNINEKYTIYLRPSNEKLTFKWILHAEITLKKLIQSTTRRELKVVFHQIFYPQITFEKNCHQNECFEDYSVGLLNDPIWNQQTEEPILFSFKLTNKGDFLTHLIIDASLSMDCKIIIPDMEIVPIINSEPSGLKPKKSNIRVMYKQPTSHLGTFDFIVQALCPQVHSQISDPVLKLSIQSFLTGDTKKFEFTANAEYKVEFLIEAMALPVVSKRVCRHSETEENVEFNIELFIGGAYYDNNLTLSAVLYIEDSAGASVMSLDIKSNDCKVIEVDHLSQHPHDRVTHNFKITKAFNVQNIRMSLSYKMMIKPTKDFQITLKVEPVLESDSPYKLKLIMANEAEYIVMISFQYCKKERFIMIFVALCCAILIFCCLILLYYKCLLPRYIVPRQDLTFIISNFENFGG